MISKIIKSRIFLLVIVPIFLIWIMLGYYYSLGKLIKTDNAYVKAPIISVQSEVSGKIKKVLHNNPVSFKGSRLNSRKLLNYCSVRVF